MTLVCIPHNSVVRVPVTFMSKERQLKNALESAWTELFSASR